MSGITVLDLTWIDSSAPLNADGVLLVDGATDASLFTLQGAEEFGLFTLALRARDGGLYLVQAIDPQATEFVVLGRLPADSWYQSFDAIRANIAARGSLLPRLGLWGQVYASEDRTGSSGDGELFGIGVPVSTKLETNRQGAQVGIDGSVAGIVLGVTGGVERSRADAGIASEADVDGFNIGVYAGIGGSIGPYATALLKHDRLDIKFRNASIYSPKLDGRSTGADLELGWRFPLLAVSADLNAGVSVVRSDIDEFQSNDVVFDAKSPTSIRGRIGGRVTFNGPLRPFVEVRGFHEFGDDSSLLLASGDVQSRLRADGRGTWGRIEAGIGGGNKRPLLSGWADLGDRKGWGLRAGFRF